MDVRLIVRTKYLTFIWFYLTILVQCFGYLNFVLKMGEGYSRVGTCNMDISLSVLSVAGFNSRLWWAISRDFPWLFDHTLPFCPEPAWQKMAPSSLYGST